jgi:hypothetical protein
MTAATRTRPEAAELGAFRADVLAVCGQLGMLEHDIEQICEVVTGVRWEDCQPSDLVQVLGEISRALHASVAGQSE